MIREVKAGEWVVVMDGDFCRKVWVVRISLQRRAMFVSTEPEGAKNGLPEFWLPMTAFLDWPEPPDTYSANPTLHYEGIRFYSDDEP